MTAIDKHGEPRKYCTASNNSLFPVPGDNRSVFWRDEAWKNGKQRFTKGSLLYVLYNLLLCFFQIWGTEFASFRQCDPISLSPIYYPFQN